MTGATGFAGRYIYQQFVADGWQITTVGRALPDDFSPQPKQHVVADLLHSEKIAEIILQHRPAIVIHSAALSKPNDCEVQKDAAYALNTAATQNIATACAHIGARLVFMSTDFVFNNEGPYVEDSKTCPVNYYGSTKAMAEESIANTLANHLIIRTVLVYGRPQSGQQPGFLQWVVNNLRRGETLHIYTDQVRTPCYAPDLAKGIHLLIQQDARGTFHVCGQEAWTPYTMAVAVAEHLHLDTALIKPVTAAQRPELAQRPSNASLCIDKLKATTGFEPTALGDALPVIFEEG